MSIPTARLCEVATIERDMIAPDDIPSGTTYVGLEHVESSGNFVGVGEVANGELASTKFAFNPTHVLYGKLRPYLSKIARPNFVGVCTTEIVPIKPGPRLDRDYLFHFLRLPRMVAFATSRCSGANLPRLSPKMLAEFEIPLPPLAEQKRIAAVLDKADALRAKRRQALATLDTLLQSVFLDMFGDPVTNRKGWPKLRGELLFSKDRSGTRCGPFGSALKRDEYVPAGIPVWQIDNVAPNRFGEPGALYITETKYRELTSYTVQSGDILVSRAGTVGRMCVARPTVSPSIIGTNLIRLALDPAVAVPEFFTSLCTYFPRALRLRAGSDDDGYSFMNTTTLASVQLIVPPIALQEEFAARLARIRLLENTHARGVVAFDALFASLQSAAFAGTLFDGQAAKPARRAVLDVTLNPSGAML